MIGKIFFYFIVILIEIVVVAMFIPNEMVLKEIDQEQSQVVQVLGPQPESAVRSRANDWFRVAFYDSGFMRVFFDVLSPSAQQREASAGLESFGNEAFSFVDRRVETFFNAIYQATYRTALFVAWVPFVIPIAIPALADGLISREIKKHTLGYSSPVRYHAATHTLIFLIAAVPIYLMLPFSVHPLIVPVWAIAAAVTLSVFTANIQQRL